MTGYQDLAIGLDGDASANVIACTQPCGDFAIAVKTAIQTAISVVAGQREIIICTVKPKKISQTLPYTVNSLN